MKIDRIKITIVIFAIIIQISSAFKNISNVNPSKDIEMPNSERTTVVYQNGTVKELYCCNRYYLKGNVYKAYCENGCLNGTCLESRGGDNCICNLGYKFDKISQNCQPICPGKCSNGYCFKPNLCKCNQGYKLNPQTQKCQPICTGKCGNGFCQTPGICKCNPGYQLNNSTASKTACQPLCLGGKCPNHSKCIKPNECACDKGYKYNSSHQTCDPVCLDICINGTCKAPGQCECFLGFSLKENMCKDGSCTSVTCKNGYCLANGECVCHKGFVNFLGFLLGTHCETALRQFSRLFFILISIACVVGVVLVLYKKLVRMRMISRNTYVALPVINIE